MRHISDAKAKFMQDPADFADKLVCGDAKTLRLVAEAIDWESLSADMDDETQKALMRQLCIGNGRRTPDKDDGRG